MTPHEINQRLEDVLKPRHAISTVGAIGFVLLSIVATYHITAINGRLAQCERRIDAVWTSIKILRANLSVAPLPLSLSVQPLFPPLLPLPSSRKDEGREKQWGRDNRLSDEPPQLHGRLSAIRPLFPVAP